jgi:hypothetical protein
MASIDDFRLRYAQFAATDDATVNALLGDAAAELVQQVWGSLWQRAVYALAAHMLEASAAATNAADLGAPGTSLAGAITSLKTGDLAMGFGAAAGQGSNNKGGLADEPYKGTVGGREYLRLRGRLRLAPRVTGLRGGC